MRSSSPIGLAAALSLVFAACTDQNQPLGPADRPAPGPVPEASVVSFGITTIGDPEGSSAPALNDLGQVLLAQGDDRYVWTNGTLLALLAPFDAQRVQAFDLNADATVVGDVDGHAAAWVNGELTLLQVPTTIVSSQAFAINNAGQIVGQAFEQTNGPFAVLWQNKDQPMTVLPGGGGTAQSINSAGAIVGNSLNQDRNFLLGAYWASPTSSPQFLKGPNGQPCGSPHAVNDRGEIAGFCGSSGAYWPSPGANAVSLGGSSSATDINELGQILGVVQGSQFDRRPTLWQQEGPAFRAFDLGVPAGKAEAFPEEINNHGQVAGEGSDPAGVAVLWQVPVRATLDVVPGTGASVKLSGTGTVAAALIGSAWFHAGDIDPSTLTLGNDDGIETPVARKKGAPVAKLTDANRDGTLDLVVEFDKQTMTRSGDLVAGTQTLVVQGRLRDGTRLRGADQVTAVR